MNAEKLLREAERQGFRVKRTKKGAMVYGKKPKDGMVTLHLTCSDHRALRNAVAHLRKIGVTIK